MQRSGFRQRRFRSESESGENENGEGGSSSPSRMKCRSCKEEYRCDGDEAGTCRKCFEKAGETVDEHKSKSDFLELLPLSTLNGIPNAFSEVVLVASGEDSQLVASGEDSQLGTSSPPIRANWAVLTHPTQSCFMSSIDVHTHYSYQIMLPEAIAIVMAPRDSKRKHGIFRLTSGGMTVMRQCPRRGFHSHDPPSDGSPIYRHCTDV